MCRTAATANADADEDAEWQWRCCTAERGTHYEWQKFSYWLFAGGKMVVPVGGLWPSAGWCLASKHLPSSGSTCTHIQINYVCYLCIGSWQMVAPSPATVRWPFRGESSSRCNWQKCTKNRVVLSANGKWRRRRRRRCDIFTLSFALPAGA